ncbi:hypothetical protein SUGI_0401180 [Cryptomeria japonica]|nr:hypothetical protein SUGI_0401180 [Cryptomeria japonica]
MGKRRLAHVASSSDDEPDHLTPIPLTAPPATVTGTGTVSSTKEKDKGEEPGEEEKQKEEGEEDEGPDLRPLGEVIKKSGRGRSEKKHYAAFDLDGNRYQLEDPVLVTPEEKNEKPYVAIIKEIKQSRDGSIAILGQWFYRPEEADRKGGGYWQSRDTRELFYSFHHDEVPAESVMHKCVAHFIPLNKQIPPRSKHPGFIVQKVYDTVEKKLWKLTDKDYEDSKQKEIDLLVQKTRNVLGELPDVIPDELAADQEEPEKNKRNVRRRTLAPLSIHKDEDATGRSEPFGKVETPGSTMHEGQGGNYSEIYTILLNQNMLTGVRSRDRWLEKIIQGVKHMCSVNGQINSKDKMQGNTEAKPVSAEEEAQEQTQKAVDQSDGLPEKITEDSKVEDNIVWPDAAVEAIVALEKAAYESLGSDNHKYNLKMRQLEFNLKGNAILSKRLLKKELEACIVLNMSPAELKDGLTTEEKTAQEPQELQTMQMTDVRCSICTEKKVGVRDIIHVGYGDRYQLECLKCGNLWYASRDSISSLTIEPVNPVSPVGTAPLATTKFDEIEKVIGSSRESEKPANEENVKKEIPAGIPVIDRQSAAGDVVMVQ